jgi:hypothetical protein
LMEIHHNTSLKSILEDDSISLASVAHICCLGKGARLWLVVRPFICSFHIAHSIFTLMLHFRRSLVKPSTFTFLMCECGHGLNAFSTHLACCPFEG